MRLTAAELIPTRATLIERLKNWQDQASWLEFFEIDWKLIYCVARKAGLTEAQDAVQESLIAVAKHMPTFKYGPSLGSFEAWLLKMARWRIVDQFRKRGPMSQHHKRPAGSRTATGTAKIEAVPDVAGVSVDQLWETEWRGQH